LLNNAIGITVDKNGVLYVADKGNYVIRRLVPLASGKYSSTVISGTVGSSTTWPQLYGIAITSGSPGTLYINDSTKGIYSIAISGTRDAPIFAAPTAFYTTLKWWSNISVYSNTALYIAMSNQIKKFAIPATTLTVFAGNSKSNSGYTGSGTVTSTKGTASGFSPTDTNYGFSAPSGANGYTSVDPSGNVYFIANGYFMKVLASNGLIYTMGNYGTAFTDAIIPDGTIARNIAVGHDWGILGGLNNTMYFTYLGNLYSVS